MSAGLIVVALATGLTDRAWGQSVEIDEDGVRIRTAADVANVDFAAKTVTRGFEIDIVGPGVDLQEVIDAIPFPGETKPWLVRLGPGVYDLGPTPLVMRPWVSLTGSGEGVTRLEARACSNNPPLAAAVAMVENTRLSELSVDNTCFLGDFYSIAIYSDASASIEQVTATASFGSAASPANRVVAVFNSGALKMDRVTAVATGGDRATGVYNSGANTSDTEMTRVEASGSSTSGDAYGVHNLSSSSPTIRHLIATAQGGTSSYGVRNENVSSPIMEHVHATVSGAGDNYAFYTTSRLQMQQVVGRASGGSSSYGLYIGTAISDSWVQDSDFEGDTAGVRLGGFSDIPKLVNTRIVGGVTNDTPSTQCLGTYDEGLADVSC